MKKQIIGMAGLAVATMLISGCVMNQERIEYKTYKPIEKSKINEKDIPNIVNGKLKYNNNIILDEEGDIIFSTIIDNNIYYFIKKDRKENDKTIYILKDLDKNKIKEFEAEYAYIQLDTEGNILIFIQKENNYIYDNLFLFNGKDIKLINKNIYQKKNETYLLGYSFIKNITEDGPMKGTFNNWYYKIDLTSDNTSNIFKTKYPEKTIFGQEMPSNYRVITTSGKNIIYSYKDVNNDIVIELKNMKTNEQKTLLKESNSFCQLLYLGNKKILRIITNKKITNEMYFDSDMSKYDNEPAVYIDLNTLNEVEINIKDFNKLILISKFENLGGGITTDRYITFSLSTLHYSNKSGGPLF